jgi:hypothetical protein
MATPTPLPIVTSRTEDPDKIRETFQNLLIYLRRTRAVLFDTSVTDNLTAQLSAIGERPKDIYTFGLGTVVTTPDEPGYAVTPLDAVADGTIVEAYARGQKPAEGPIAIQVVVNGAAIALLGVDEGADRKRIGIGKGITKGDQIRVVVMEAPSPAGFDDAVIQVMVS